LTVNTGSQLIRSGLLVGVLLWSGSILAQSVSDEPGKSSSARHDVILTLKIADKHSGLMLEAKKSVPQGSNAFQILQDTVAIKYKTYPDLGVFVTSICGIDAPQGMVWTFTIDSKWSTVGIGSLTLERDVVIEWATH
jgi:uncharacterized protein DUF4430